MIQLVRITFLLGFLVGSKRTIQQLILSFSFFDNILHKSRLVLVCRTRGGDLWMLWLGCITSVDSNSLTTFGAETPQITREDVKLTCSVVSVQWWVYFCCNFFEDKRFLSRAVHCSYDVWSGVIPSPFSWPWGRFVCLLVEVYRPK